MRADRSKLIKVIHVARRELGMEDETYRLMLVNLPALKGKTSTAELSAQQLGTVLDALKGKGFKVKSKKSAGKPHNFESQSMPLMITKVEALLADMKLPWAYADAIALRMFGVEKCAWIRDMKQLKALIASLHVEAEKRALLGQVEELLAAQGVTLDQYAQIHGLKEGWQRQRAVLKRILKQLLYKEGQ